MAQYGRNVSSKKAAFMNPQPQSSTSSTDNPQETSFTGRGYVNLKGKNSDYGKPVEGSKTELRGKQAGVHVSAEVVELCEVIQSIGHTLPDGTFGVTFGVLFDIYTRISNKLVGMLMRARKQKLIDFEGEMLFQRRDDHVMIRLLRAPVELQEEIERRKSALSAQQVTPNQ